MNRNKVVIADDEVLTRKRIRSLVEQYPDYEVVAEASTGHEALDMIKMHRPDLILLDINMPTMTGMEILRSVEKSHYKILVFITAHDEFAIEAFENEALDYLLKPFNKSRFSKLMDRVGRQLNLLGTSKKTFIVAKYQGVNHRIELNLILYIKADDNYVALHTEQRSYRKRESIAAISNQLGSNFIRIHRSTIVNKNEVTNLQHLMQGDFIIQMSNGKRLTSSKSYRNQVRTSLL